MDSWMETENNKSGWSSVVDDAILRATNVTWLNCCSFDSTLGSKEDDKENDFTMPVESFSDEKSGWSDLQNDTFDCSPSQLLTAEIGRLSLRKVSGDLEKYLSCSPKFKFSNVKREFVCQQKNFCDSESQRETLKAQSLSSIMEKLDNKKEVEQGFEKSSVCLSQITESLKARYQQGIDRFPLSEKEEGCNSTTGFSQLSENVPFDVNKPQLDYRYTTKVIQRQVKFIKEKSSNECYSEVDLIKNSDENFSDLFQKFTEKGVISSDLVNAKDDLEVVGSICESSERTNAVDKLAETENIISNQVKIENDLTISKIKRELIKTEFERSSNELSGLKGKYPLEGEQITEEKELENDDISLLHPSTSKVVEIPDESSPKDHPRKKYFEYIESYLKHEEECIKEFSEDYKYKILIKDIKRVINTTVNATSSVNLYEKVKNLTILLEGGTLPGLNGPFSTSSHPLAIRFSTLLLARRVVRAGENAVSSTPSSAFPYAFIAASLLPKFHHFALILHATFSSVCPFIAPKQCKWEPDDTDQTYYKRLALLCGERREYDSPENILRRLTGILNLYSGILILASVREVVHDPSPYSLNEAWQWIVSFISVEPVHEISSTLLDVFLRVTSYLMYQAYGGLFKKILLYIDEHYVPELRKVIIGEYQGSVQKFHDYLKVMIGSGDIDPPDGLVEFLDS